MILLNRRASLSWLPIAACVALVWSAAGRSLAFCDLPFEEVAHSAPIVVLAEYRAPSDEDPYLSVVEVLRGRTDAGRLALGEHGLQAYRPRRGDQFLLALTPERTLVASVSGMGFCTPTSVLAIRKGKVRSQDRANWDGTGKPPPLEELLASLRSGRSGE
jgi:hypothetical protein